MADFGRFDGTDYRDRDRERRWRDEDRNEGGFFSSRNEPRDWPARERDPARTEDGGRFRGPDRDRELLSRDNQPGRLVPDLDFRRERNDRSSPRREPRDSERNRYGNDDSNRSLPIDETEQLIASNKVEGTPVYGREGERLGTIYNFMVDKYSGRVTYAVLSYGGFLGVGQRYYPVPWQILSYDTHEGGYRIDMDYHDLERAPSFSRNEEPRFNRDYGRRVHNWYGLDY